jgi:hypothetical protein
LVAAGTSMGGVGSVIHQRGRSISRSPSSYQRSAPARAIRTFPRSSLTKTRSPAGAVLIGYPRDTQLVVSGFVDLCRWSRERDALSVRG